MKKSTAFGKKVGSSYFFAVFLDQKAIFVQWVMRTGLPFQAKMLKAQLP